MALPTETLPKEAGDLNETPAYFDQAKKLKQDKNLANNVSTGLPPEVQVNSTQESEVEPEDQGGQVIEEYKPFPLNPEEESIQADNQDEEGNEEQIDEQQLAMMQAQLDQARQLALLKAQAEQAQIAEQEQANELTEGVSSVDVENAVIEKGSEKWLDLTSKAALPVLIDFTGAAAASAAYLNLYIIGSVLGFVPASAKPKSKHYIMLIIVDLEIIIAIIAALFLFNLLVYIVQHPYKIGWEAFKDWSGYSNLIKNK